MICKQWLRRIACLIVAAVAGTVLVCGETGAGKPNGSLTIDLLMKIKHPSNPVWSPDGRRVMFVWDEKGVGNLYVAGSSGDGCVPLTRFHEGQVGNAFWSRDSNTIYFAHEGTLWQADASGGEPRPAWGSEVKATSAFLSPNGSRFAIVRAEGHEQGSDLIIRDESSGHERLIAHSGGSMAGVTWSPDGKYLAYSGNGKTILHHQTPAYSGAKIDYTITERSPGKLYVVPSEGGSPVAMDAPEGFGAVRWSDGRHLVFDRQSADFKKRTTYVADAVSGKATVLHESVDSKFWSMPSTAGDAAQPSPDGKWIAFLSDEDGWDHLYVVPARGGKAVQITKGHFESWRPEWSHDSGALAFDANSEGHPGDRQIFIAKLNGGPEHASIEQLTNGPGTNIAPSWAPDDHSLVYQHTDTQHSADLFTVAAHSGGKPVQMTRSMPIEMEAGGFVEPEFVHYPGADGSAVPGWLFVPKNLDRSRKHPAIVWIHGDGINQNYDGWHVQRNYAVYYSFHQYLLQQGYVVFAPDYRGSIGYGRDWRQGVYMDVGGKDAKDAWLSAKYLATLPYVDAQRISVWGLSYGGFFTLIAMTDQPTLFRAGVDVAGVADYRMYYEDPYHGAWTASRIGTPEQHPDVYDRASPVSHIGQLQRPLLILHGTADINVPFLHSVKLVDEGLKHGKGNLMQLMLYPGEFHYFDREHVLADAWRRVDGFFRTNLGPASSPSD